MSKLYLLRPVDNDPLWKPWYDKAFGFVVCAESEEEARKLAQEDGGSELYDDDYDKKQPAWTDPTHSTCVELKPTDKSEVIMQDFQAA